MMSERLPQRDILSPFIKELREEVEVLIEAEHSTHRFLYQVKAFSLFGNQHIRDLFFCYSFFVTYGDKTLELLIESEFIHSYRSILITTLYYVAELILFFP